MDLARLKPLLPPAVAAQVDVLWRRFTARHREGDINDFVAALHADGHLDADQLRTVLSSVDVTLTLSDPSASGSGGAPVRSRHRLLGLLGKGAMGEVFIARDPELRRNVAIKRMDARHARNAVLAARFAHEVQITAQLDHPSIVPVYGLEPQADGTLAYSMKLIRGRTLKQLLDDARARTNRQQPLPSDLQLPARLEIFLQVCSAIGHAHTRGVIHRDLKPDNIMVGAFNEVVVMDWGVARLVGGVELVTDVETSGGRAERTQHGVVLGTPRYMAPEQAQGRNDELDARADQYALGLILFELVSLRQARSGKSASQVLDRAVKGEKDPLVHLDPRERIPRELAAIVRRATAVDRLRRYVDVVALAEDVRRYLRDEAVLAEPDDLRQRAMRWIARNRQAALALGAMLGLLVVLVAGLGVGAALVVREVARSDALAREARLAELVGLTAAQSRHMETALLRYEGLLQGLAAVAEARLSGPVAPQPYYLAEAFTMPGRAPPDLVPSRFYDTRISLGSPDVILAPGVVETEVTGRIAQLTSLTSAFRDVHRTSAAGTGDWEARARGEGLPLVWSYVATDEGLLVGYPGTGVYPSGYDPREQHWYKSTRDALGVVWEPAYLDESGMGLLVTAARAVRGPDGAPIGVAAVDITVGFVIDNFLVPTGISTPVEGWLVDATGRVVVRSGLAQDARRLSTWEPPPFPYAPVLAAVRARPESGHAVHEGTLYTWSALPTLGWTYLVSGPTTALLDG